MTAATIARTVDIGDLKARLNARVLAVVAYLLPNGRQDGHEWRAGSVAGEPGQSLGVRLSGPKAGTWCDFTIGPEESGDLIDLWQATRRVDMPTALREICQWLGISDDRGDRHEGSRRREVLPRPAKPQAQPIDNGFWRQIWRETVEDGPHKAYLLSRLGRLPGDLADLRYHPHCPRGRDRLPAMVALIRAAENDPKGEINQPIGIHRTFLARRPNGTWGKADLDGPVKMMLGRAARGAIKLSADEDVTLGLGICEGVEDGLAILNSEWAPIWCCMSASNMAAFPILNGVEALTVFCDADSPGLKAAHTVVKRWRLAGKEAVIAEPPEGMKDFGELHAG